MRPKLNTGSFGKLVAMWNVASFNKQTFEHVVYGIKDSIRKKSEMLESCQPQMMDTNFCKILICA